MYLRAQLLKYLQEHEGYIASGDLQRLPWPKYKAGQKKGLHTPRSVVRRLEELQNDGKIVVEYRGNHAFYSATQKKSPYPKKVYLENKVFEIKNQEEEAHYNQLKEKGLRHRLRLV